MRDILTLNYYDPRLIGAQPVDDTDTAVRLNLVDQAADAPQALQQNPLNYADNSQISQSTTITNNNTTAGGGGLQVPKRFTAKKYRVIKLDLTTAQVNFPLNIGGTFFHAHWAATWTGAGIGVSGQTLLDGPAYDTGNGTNVRGAGDPAVQAAVRFDYSDYDEIAFGPGYQRSGVAFARMFLSWDAQPGKVLELTIATDEPLDRIDAVN
jgi:hypothetical protein